MSQYIPPIVLVKTWLQLVNFSVEKEVSGHAKKMIDRNFGSVDLAITYIEQIEQNQQKPVKLPLFC